ncbi:hypothetical protein DH2020_043528 [Rehmannia glutinosa]|uniref:Uncharacterized protein n=1 Tax=Rehmannia glutinosa TaxID=99300 RepID=A0ABR0UL80_REHGL
MAKEQLQVLNALDVAKTQWYHFTAIVIAGMGFFTDAYDLFCISLVTKLLGRIYYHHEGALKPGTLPPNVAAAVNGVAFCGTLAGQLFFGWLGDKLGRKKVYGMTLMVMVICSVASGLSFSDKPKSVMATLCFFRFWLGFGIGGDYPPPRSCPNTRIKRRVGAFIAAVLAMQGFGILAGGMVAIIVSAAFRSAFPAPAYEVTRYTALVAKNAKLAAANMSKVLQVELEAEQEKVDGFAQEKGNDFGLFSKEFLRRHGLHLLGTTSTWFLLDIAFYSQNLFQKDIFSAIGWIPPAKTMNALEEDRLCDHVFAHVLLCEFRSERDYIKSSQPRFSRQAEGSSKRDAGYPAGIGVKNSLIVLGCINALGMIFTFLVPESNGKSLEEMSQENEEGENGTVEMRPSNSVNDIRTVPV